MEDKLIREAQQLIELEQLRDSIKQMIPYIPLIAKMTMDMYEGFKEAGFSDGKAFEFAKDFILKSIYHGNK